MIFTIYVFDIVWDVDKEDCICVGADGEDYYETPELPTEHSFTIERDELGYCSNAYREERNDLIGNVLTKKEGFFVKTFDYSIRAVVEDSLPMEYYEEEEEGISEGIPPEQLPEIPFPPPKVPKGKWEEGCDTEEREEEITMEFVKYYKLPSIDAIKHFVDNYKGDNEAMPIVRNWLWWSSGKADFIYESFIKIMENPMDEEKCKEVGKRINYECSQSKMSPSGIYCFRGANSIGAMRSVFYLVSWYFESSNNMCIKAYPRLLEHYWSGIGEWLA